ncbi:MAG TPA: arsenic resistance N-acetyltransferase ArsN2 [Longimicrobiales bacterium]
MNNVTDDVMTRTATARDLSAVQSLLRAADLPLDGVTDFFPDNYAVAQRGNEVVGAIGVERYGEHGLLRSAVVTPSMRGAGLGAQLTRERLAWCRRQGLADVFLLTTTAAPFFERIGFSRVDRASVPAELAGAPEFASICPSTAVVMRLPLT